MPNSIFKLFLYSYKGINYFQILYRLEIVFYKDTHSIVTKPHQTILLVYAEVCIVVSPVMAISTEVIKQIIYKCSFFVFFHNLKFSMKLIYLSQFVICFTQKGQTDIGEKGWRNIQSDKIIHDLSQYVLSFISYLFLNKHFILYIHMYLVAYLSFQRPKGIADNEAFRKKIKINEKSNVILFVFPRLFIHNFKLNTTNI